MISLPPSPFPSPAHIGYTQVLSEADIVKRQDQMVTSVVSVLSVTESAAAILLRHFKWDVTRLHDHWFQDEDAVRQAAGLPPARSPEGGDGGDGARPVRARACVCACGSRGES